MACNNEAISRMHHRDVLHEPNSFVVFFFVGITRDVWKIEQFPATKQKYLYTRQMCHLYNCIIRKHRDKALACFFICLYLSWIERLFRGKRSEIQRQVLRRNYLINPPSSTNWRKTLPASQKVAHTFTRDSNTTWLLLLSQTFLFSR